MPVRENWCLRRRVPQAWLEQIAPLGLDPLLARVLYARKLDTPEQIAAFLSDEGDLGDPFLLAGMREAVGRLSRALDEGQQIVVYGDFDADGVCATALLVSALKALGGRVSPYIPDRFDEGYGLNEDALTWLQGQGAQVLVTVDSGVRSLREAAHGQMLGLDIIITDHHSLGAELPSAVAVINPKRPDCGYPFKELSGVGVAYRLVEALFCDIRQRSSSGPGCEQYLDLVALGTVADIVPLCGENRLLVQRGLGRLRAAPRPGVRALMDAAKVMPDKVGSQDIAFRLGPRLNAAGRLASAMLAYDLLMSDDENQAQRLATELNALNEQRQQLLEVQVSKARQLLGESDGRTLLFVAGEGFHEGIVGLVASRLTDGFYLPSLVMCRGAETTRGSARSIEGFHITQALDHCADLLSRYGGHARAAGFTLANENLAEFRTRLAAYSAQHLPGEILGRRHMVDTIVTLDELSFQTAAALAPMEPTGEGNPEPALATLGLTVTGLRVVGQDGKHLRLDLSDGRRRCPAIAFRQGYRMQELRTGEKVDIIYRPSLNEWQGQVSLQLVVETIRKSDDAPHGPNGDAS